MTGQPKHWWHAARVAGVAAVVVVTCYALCAVGLRQLVVQRLTAEADARLVPVLAHAGTETFGAPEGSQSSSALPTTTTAGGTSKSIDPDGLDPDGPPIFVWRIDANGSVHDLTVGAPALPDLQWSAAPVTTSIAGVPFRLDARRAKSGWLVAGQSVTDVERVSAALVLPGVLFGLLLGLATFAGALIVGLRASAPLDVIRRRQAEFTADASHELRTPLSVVEAEVDLALRRRRRPEEYEAVLRRIAGEGRRLRRIVDDLLWLARADSDTGHAAGRERADVEAVVRATVERFQPVAQRRSVALAFDAYGVENEEGASATVPADAELVDRLAGVLVDNACKYAGPGGVVDVSVRTAGSRVVLTVDDSGPGIPPEKRAEVFDRFHRVSDTDEGAGLGLAIAASVVRITGGSSEVGESPLGGARLAVSWKRAPADEGAPSRGGRAPARRDPAPAPAASRRGHA